MVRGGVRLGVITPIVTQMPGAHAAWEASAGVDELVRIAGTAELNGWNTSLDPVRCDALTARTFELFPDAGERDSVRYWTGLRPATPSNAPLIGATRYRNLFLNTGHGTLGWTMACGSGRALADIVGGRKPDVDFRFAHP